MAPFSTAFRAVEDSDPATRREAGASKAGVPKLELGNEGSMGRGIEDALVGEVISCGQ